MSPRNRNHVPKLPERQESHCRLSAWNSRHSHFSLRCYQRVRTPVWPTSDSQTGHTAVDFAFGFDGNALTSGEFALKFDNVGTQPHEMTLFRVPNEATVAEAGAASTLQLRGVPAGYEVVDHLTYAEPGESSSFTFAEQNRSNSPNEGDWHPHGGG